MRLLLAVVLSSCFLLAGCQTSVNEFTLAPAKYATVKNAVSLGMSKVQFDRIMQPVVDVTVDRAKRPDETYTENNSIMNIVFIRSGFVEGYGFTDDEYTPYVFRNDRLVAWGWRAIGGVKVTANDIRKEKAKATRVEVKNKVQVNNTPAWSAPTICITKRCKEQQGR